MWWDNIVTLIPVFVASFTACNNLSYFGLNVSVNAQSIIFPTIKVIICRTLGWTSVWKQSIIFPEIKVATSYN